MLPRTQCLLVRRCKIVNLICPCGYRAGLLHAPPPLQGNMSLPPSCPALRPPEFLHWLHPCRANRKTPEAGPSATRGQGTGTRRGGGPLPRGRADGAKALGSRCHRQSRHPPSHAHPGGGSISARQKGDRPCYPIDGWVHGKRRRADKHLIVNVTRNVTRQAATSCGLVSQGPKHPYARSNLLPPPLVGVPLQPPGCKPVPSQGGGGGRRGRANTRRPGVAVRARFRGLVLFGTMCSEKRG